MFVASLEATCGSVIDKRNFLHAKCINHQSLVTSLAQNTNMMVVTVVNG